MVRRSLIALATVFATVYACQDDDGYRRACMAVPLDGSLYEAYEVLRPAGGHYDGYVEGEHLFLRNLAWCAISIDDEERVFRVRYLEPSASW